MNTHYITYDPSTGRIITSGFTQKSAIVSLSNTILLDSEIDPEAYYVVSGKIQPLPINPNLGPYYEFDYIEKTWKYNRNRALADIVAVRNTLLQSSDWTQIYDVPMSDESRSAWQIYRQALRDITNQEDLSNIIWPILPT
jgi:hypothetical protein